MEADYAMTDQAMRDHDRYRGDENLYVKFFINPLENREKSLKEGRPMYEDAEFLSIMVPGDKDNIITREVRDEDKHRFAKQYAAFKNDAKELIEGTPLERWGFITMSQVEEMKFFNIRTVEQLANVSDGNAQKFMGINLLRTRAKEFLEVTAGGAPIPQLQEELAVRDSKIDELGQVIADLQERLQGLEDKG